jgi:hypothetical protein
MSQAKEEPRCKEISSLPLIASHIDEWLQNSEEQYATLLPARERPHVLDDYTAGRVIEVFTEQKNDLWRWEEQLWRWKNDDLTGDERQEVERLDGQLAKVRGVIDSILALAEALSEGAIEKFLRKAMLSLAWKFFWASGSCRVRYAPAFSISPSDS